MASEIDALIEDMNTKYEKVHLAFEENFWATKMDLKGCSSDALAATKTEYEAFLADPSNLAAVRRALEGAAGREGGQPPSDEQRKVLGIMEKTFKIYGGGADDPKVAQLKERLNHLEAELAEHRNAMALGHADPATGELARGSSVQLRDRMRTSDDEAVRRACYQGLRSIGPHVAERLCEIVKDRNRLGKLQGYADFYDAKVQASEGMSKGELFGVLDTLEEASRPLMQQARERLAKDKGDDALLPWNTGYRLAGDVEKAMDPFFPFEQAVDVWARSFAALGIGYRGSTMVLDLLDREKKYSNGFCHWPQPAWRRADGSWQPSAANFTSVATPSAVGSGRNALATLMHEGGHAAHFANIDQRSPFFSQERAPTSVAYAENQSMFLDSLMGDADWMARYALDREGKVIPWPLIEQHIQATHPYGVFGLRAMLAVPYFEKALYELPEDEVTPERLVALADEVEAQVQGGASSRPLLSVPHILADEASCYYHGYVLAEMSVHQTRQHFLSKYGRLTDNPSVGADLAESYWRPGNAAPFLGLVQGLTGAPLTGDAWVGELRRGTDAKVREEREAYDRAAAQGPALALGAEPDLAMRVVLVDGDEVLADSKDDGFKGACDKFKAYVRARFFGEGQAGGQK